MVHLMCLVISLLIHLIPCDALSKQVQNILTSNLNPYCYPAFRVYVLTVEYYMPTLFIIVHGQPFIKS